VPFSFAPLAPCASSVLGFFAGRSLSSCPSTLRRALRLIPGPAPFIPIAVRGDRVATMDIACCSPRFDALWPFQWYGLESKAGRVGRVSQNGETPAQSMRISRDEFKGFVQSDCACGRVWSVVMMRFRGGGDGGACRVADWRRRRWRKSGREVNKPAARLGCFGQAVRLHSNLQIRL